MSFKSQLVTGMAWSAGARLAGQAVIWANTVIVIRLLSPSDYGLMAITSLFVGFVGLLAEAGIGPAIVQVEQIDRKELQNAFGLALIINLGLYLLLFVLAPGAAWFFNEFSLVTIIRLQGLELILRAFATIPDAKLQRDLSFKSRSVVELVSIVAGSVTTLFFAFRGMGVLSLVLGNLLTAMVRMLGVQYFSPFLCRPTLNLAMMGGLLTYGRDWTLTRVLWFFYSQADVLIVGKMLGKDMLGYYSIAMHLASLPVQRVTAIINQVTFPVFARVQDKPAEAGQYLLSGLRLLGFVSFPVLWGISSVAPEIVKVILGEKWLPATSALQIIALVMPATIMVPTVSTVVQSMGRMDVTLRNVCWAAVVMPVAFLIGSGWGTTGIALAWLIAYPLVFLVNMWRAADVLFIRFTDLLATMVRPAIAGGAMYAAVWVTRFALAPSGTIGLASLVLVGAATYLAVALIIDRENYKRLFSALRG